MVEDHDTVEGGVEQGATGEVSDPVEADDVRELTYESDEMSDRVSDDDTEPPADGITQVDPDETQAVPWSPRLVPTETTDDPSGPVFGRLLGRAFGVSDRGDE